VRRVAWVVIPIVLVGLLGLVVFATRAPGSTTAFTLQPGECFDIPGDSQVGDITTLDCTQAHDAEVFVAEDLPGPSPTGVVPYIGQASIAEWVGAACGPSAQSAYLGSGSPRTDLAVGYFFPDAFAWSQGERQVTCYLHAADGSKLSAPLRGSGSGVGSSASPVGPSSIGPSTEPSTEPSAPPS